MMYTLQNNTKITVDTIKSYIDKPILLGYGNINYAWAGILKNIEYYNEEEPTLDNAGLMLEDCVTLINHKKLIPVNKCTFDKEYLSDGQLHVHELTSMQLKAYNTRVKQLNK